MIEQYTLSASDILSKMDTVMRITGEQAFRYSEANAEEWNQAGWYRVGIDLLPMLRPFAPLYVSPDWILGMYRLRKKRITKAQIWAFPRGARIPDIQEFHSSPDDLFPETHPPLARSPMDIVQGDDSPQSYLLALLLSSFFKGVLAGETTWDIMRFVIDYHALDESNEREYGIKKSIDKMTWIHEQPEDWRPVVIFDERSVSVKFYSYATIHQYCIYQCEGEFQRGDYEPMSVKGVLIAR